MLSAVQFGFEKFKFSQGTQCRCTFSNTFASLCDFYFKKKTSLHE